MEIVLLHIFQFAVTVVEELETKENQMVEKFEVTHSIHLSDFLSWSCS